ncbi:hypothetical protein TL16_g06281 [Triparma laevis f. inornata]|uniref:Uncharacterized protein n=1 Tax=Triparma laevis f. inornata TaxID=1714386 RepID=A0A9W7AQS2_9STRA|nr:hypothetical protein TL16_g06281 [Triparma laevis f. inornata]
MSTSRDLYTFHYTATLTMTTKQDAIKLYRASNFPAALLAFESCLPSTPSGRPKAEIYSNMSACCLQTTSYTLAKQHALSCVSEDNTANVNANNVTYNATSTIFNNSSSLSTSKHRPPRRPEHNPNLPIFLNPPCLLPGFIVDIVLGFLFFTATVFNL